MGDTNRSLPLSAFYKKLPPLEVDKPNNVFDRFLIFIADTYKIRVDKSTMNYRQLKRIYELAVEDNYSLDEFAVLLKRFAKTNPFDNFTAAHFFQVGRLYLYPESWKKKETEKNINAIADMEAFLVNDESGNSKVFYRYYNPDNPVINHPNIKIYGKGWDVGGHYSHQYENNKESRNE